MKRMEKARQTQETNRAHWRKQCVKLKAGWKIERVDEMNWAIVRDGRTLGYYGRLVDALFAVPGKILDAEAAGSLKQISELMDEVRKMINRLDLSNLRENGIRI